MLHNKSLGYFLFVCLLLQGCHKNQNIIYKENSKKSKVGIPMSDKPRFKKTIFSRKFVSAKNRNLIALRERSDYARNNYNRRFFSKKNRSQKKYKTKKRPILGRHYKINFKRNPFVDKRVISHRTCFMDLTNNLPIMANMVSSLSLKELLYLRQANQCLNRLITGIQKDNFNGQKSFIFSSLTLPGIDKDIWFINLKFNEEYVHGFAFFKLFRKVTKIPKYLWQQLPLTNIEEIDISFMDLNDEDLQFLSSCIRYSKLRRIVYTSNEPKCRGIQKLGESLPFCPNIEELYLRFNELNAEQAYNLTKHVHRCSHMKDIDLYGNNLQDQGGIWVAENCKNSSIKRINLSSNRITTLGACEIVERLALTDMRHVGLANNSMENEVENLAKLGSIIKKTKIEILDLSRNKIGSKGMIKLIENLSGSRLKELYIDSNNINIIKHVEKMGRLLQKTSIIKVDISGNDIRKKEMTYLQKTYPNVEWICQQN